MSAVRADIQRYRSLGGADLSTLRVLFACHGLHATLVYRFGSMLARWWRVAPLRSLVFWPLLPPGLLLYALGALVVRKGYGIRLDLSAKIGPGLYIGHFGGIHVANCTLGEHCSIAQQCRIGRSDEREGPQIGKRVWVGAHARVWGAVTVGDGSTIGAGAWVGQNVPPRTLIMGNPARVVSSNYDNSRIL